MNRLTFAGFFIASKVVENATVLALIPTQGATSVLVTKRGGCSQQALSFNMVVLPYKSLPHKASFLPLTVGQKSFFSPSAPLFPYPSLFFLILLFPRLLSHPPIPSSHLPLLSFPFFCSSCLSSLPPPSSSSPKGQLVCVELTTRQLLHCLLSPSSCPLHNNTQPCSANQQPEPQQYRTPTWPIGEEVLGEEAPVV